MSAIIIASVEGAVIMCRAEQSIAPLEAVATEIHDQLGHALPDRPTPVTRHGRDRLPIYHPPSLRSRNAHA
ncbi:hypothetical protein [Streptomyces sp. NPDC017993]|uniref:LmrA/YxaF family transcription factor n=1 Tax=Streptomyces sp. NPDC017993 TaxID=3365027 RepID=UPI00379959E3